MFNATNPAQGSFKRVLCVCSAGLLRSPTAAVVLASEPFVLNTRAAGLEADYALIPVDEVLLEWAQEIVCMTRKQEIELRNKHAVTKPILCLDIPDDFEYRHPELMKMIAERYTARSQELQKK